jgi:hypothetical protein
MTIITNENHFLWKRINNEDENEDLLMTPILKESMTLGHSSPIEATSRCDDDCEFSPTEEYPSNLFLPTFHTPKEKLRPYRGSQIDSPTNWKITSPHSVWSEDYASDWCTAFPDASRSDDFLDISSSNGLKSVMLQPRFSSNTDLNFLSIKMMNQLSNLDDVKELDASNSIIDPNFAQQAYTDSEK